MFARVVGVSLADYYPTVWVGCSKSCPVPSRDHLPLCHLPTYLRDIPSMPDTYPFVKNIKNN